MSPHPYIGFGPGVSVPVPNLPSPASFAPLRHGGTAPAGEPYRLPHRHGGHDAGQVSCPAEVSGDAVSSSSPSPDTSAFLYPPQAGGLGAPEDYQAQLAASMAALDRACQDAANLAILAQADPDIYEKYVRQFRR
jgi:hypothetical protein